MRIFNETYEYSNLISRAGKSLMMTTAMTAVGLISMSSNANAQAASGPWDLSVDEGNLQKISLRRIEILLHNSQTEQLVQAMPTLI